MGLETEILLNQIAQGIRPIEDAVSVGVASEELWESLRRMVQQAHPSREDVEAAIGAAGLERTFTPCVLLLKDRTPARLAQVSELRGKDAERALRLLLAVFSVADARRRASCPPACHHGWHRDLSDPAVLAEIRLRGHI